MRKLYSMGTSNQPPLPPDDPPKDDDDKPKDGDIRL